MSELKTVNSLEVIINLKTTNIEYVDESLDGPFYCGMSRVMTLPQFSIYLYCPTSTSVHIEVSMVFAHENGMILEFDNTAGRSMEAIGFDCSWLSRYREEDEMYVVFDTL